MLLSSLIETNLVLAPTNLSVQQTFFSFQRTYSSGTFPRSFATNENTICRSRRLTSFSKN